MVKIRMKRMGSKKRPFYRIVVADSRRARDGRFIEELGYYNPVSEPKQFKVDSKKAKDWIFKGAQPSTTIKRLFKEYGVLEDDAEDIVEVNLINQMNVEVKEEPVVNDEVEETEENTSEEEVEENVETKEVVEDKEESEDLASEDVEEEVSVEENDETEEEKVEEA